jgi:hypothetical protein
MPFNLLIFPLVGGYYILANLKLLKFKQYRLESQRILLNSALAGIVLLCVTYVLRVIVEQLFPPVIYVLHSYLPLHTPFFGTTSFSLVIALLGTSILNRFIKKEDAIKSAIIASGNELELLLETSFSESVLLNFSLSNGKFYIGWAKELPLPFASNYIRIIPAFSGYRNETKELVFTTQYLSVYAQYIEEGTIRDIHELNTDLIITIDDIVTVSFFDLEMYQRFNPQVSD